MIPTTYLQWRRCIEVDCGLVLSTGFIGARLAARFQPGNLYGKAHLARVVGWNRQAQAEHGP